jgi:hypothetical protein
MENINNNDNLIHSLDECEKKSTLLSKVLIFLLVLALGIGTGYGMSQYSKSKTPVSKQQADTAVLDTDKTEGVTDTKNFKDTATGILIEGGIDGEGQFHLQRPGGESQNVYLTSSTIDLTKYLNKNVQIWGQTFTSEKAGWLMDVGKIQEL